MVAYTKLLTLDGSVLTDEGRTMSQVRDERSVVVEKANGNLVKYIKGTTSVKWRWDLQWNWLPGNSIYNRDQGSARNVINFWAAALGSSTHTFSIQDVDNGTANFTVIIEDYQEDLLKRDMINGTGYYDVRLSLRQV